MKTKNMLQHLHALRGIAATMVVFHHSIRAFTVHWTGPELTPTHIFSGNVGVLSSGVDIFFVISGFVMVYVAGPYVRGERPLKDFIIRRIARIYPIYLIASFAVIAPLIYMGLFNHFNLQPMRLLTSALLIPSFDQAGQVQPILGVGWTLSYEMYFYLMFFLAMTLSKRWFLAILPAGLTALFFAAPAIGPGAIPTFLENPILFEFLFGSALGVLYLRGLLPSAAGWPLIVAAVFLFYSHAAFPGQWRVIFWGLPASFLVAGAICLDQQDSSSRVNSFALLLGSASYSIYLIHTTFIYLVFVPIAHMDDADMLIIAAAATSIMVGIAVFQLIENPLLRGMTVRLTTKQRVYARTI